MKSWARSAKSAHQKELDLLRESLQMAGTPQADALARALMSTRRAGENLAHAQLYGGRAPSRNAESIRDTDTAAFVDWINRGLQLAAIDYLRRYPPHGSPLTVAVDEHLHEYTPQYQAPRVIRGVDSRRSISVKNYLENKTSPLAHRWLFAAVTYFAQGRQHRIVILAKPIFVAGGHIKSAQWAWNAAKHVGVLHRTTRWVFDAGFESADMRDWLHAKGITWIIRCALSSKRILSLENGKAASVQRLIEEHMARNPKPTLDCRACQERGQLCSRLTLRGRLSKSGTTCFIEIHVSLKRSANHIAWDWESKESFAVAYDGPGLLNMAGREYGLRWTIETIFMLLENFLYKDRPKTVKSHIVTFLASVVRLAFATIALVEVQTSWDPVGHPRHLQTWKQMGQAMAAAS